LDIDTELSDPAGPGAGRHPLPTPERFAAAMAAAGIAEGTPVVAYDDASGSIAARLWWLLHVLDEPVAVLDGGMSAWPAEVTTDIPDLAAARRTPRPWPARRFLTADQVAATDAVVLDARTAQRYAAGDPSIDPRPGHIPGALSAPWADNVGADGRFLPAPVLRERFAGSVGERPVVAYCGSGVTACHDLLALAIAGRDDLALYPGSWSQWGADPSRPAVTGTDPSGP
jgi:thiosulfate/3-mercaptopyruvate sulfurtransferase